MPAVITAGPAHIAIVRLLQLGDLLCAVPALRALRAALPQARIVLVGLPSAAEFAARFRHYLDDFLAAPGFPGLPEQPADIAALPAFLAQAQARRFDLAIQLHGAGTLTNPFTALLGARRSAGFFRPGEYCPDPDTFAPYPEEGREVSRLLALMTFLGVPARGERLEFPVRPEDREALAAAMRPASLSPGRYACLHPGARAAARRWPPERFAAVADSLADSGLQVVLTGTAGERELVGRVCRAMRRPGLNLAGKTALGALGALLRGARLLVCNDTGVSHLAAALGVPSVVIFSDSDPARWAPADAECHVGLRRPAVADVLNHARRLLRREFVYAA